MVNGLACRADRSGEGGDIRRAGKIETIDPLFNGRRRVTGHRVVVTLDDEELAVAERDSVADLVGASVRLAPEVRIVQYIEVLLGGQGRRVELHNADVLEGVEGAIGEGSWVPQRTLDKRINLPVVVGDRFEATVLAALRKQSWVKALNVRRTKRAANLGSK